MQIPIIQMQVATLKTQLAFIKPIRTLVLEERNFTSNTKEFIY